MRNCNCKTLFLQCFNYILLSFQSYIYMNQAYENADKFLNKNKHPFEQFLPLRV